MNDIQIQALADGEGVTGAVQHAAGCARCAARLRDRLELMRTMRQAIDVPVPLPDSVARQADAIFGDAPAAAATAGGGTRLRARPGVRVPWAAAAAGDGHGRWMYSALAVAAATAIAVLFVAPLVKGPAATVSAAEILAKSATQLAAPITSGVELLDYELVLEGVPQDMLPDHADGVYKVSQAIDHSVPGRFRFTTSTAAGQMLTSMSQDPLARRRVMAFTAEGQPYRFDVTLPAHATSMSLPEMQQLHMQASITMMQASGQQLLETIDGPNGKQYRIEVPRVTGPGTNPVWDLSEARVLIDARDYRVTEFAVRGSFLKQDYSMSYKLIRRVLAAAVQPDTFVVPSVPGEIVIHGEGTTVPPHDVVTLALRELTRLKQPR